MNTNTPTLIGPSSHRAADQRGALPFLSGCAILGTIGLFVRYAHANPFTATWCRCVFGLLGLTFWLLVRRQVGLLRLTRTTGPWIIAAATLMMMAWTLFFTAIERTSASVAIVLFHFQPMWVLVLGGLWLGEPVGRRRIAAVMAAMVGLVLATGLVEQISLSSATGFARPGYWTGVSFCLVGAFCTASVSIIARKFAGIPPVALAWWQCAIGTAVLWIWPMKEGWPAFGVSWIWLAGLGFVHTGLAYVLLYSGMARLSIGRIAVFQFTYPAVAILIDRFVFAQPLSTYQLVGIVVMSAAIWFAERPAKV